MHSIKKTTLVEAVVAYHLLHHPFFFFFNLLCRSTNRFTEGECFLFVFKSLVLDSHNPQTKTAYGETLSIVSQFLLTLTRQLEQKYCQSQMISNSSVFMVLASGASAQSHQTKPLLYSYSDAGSHESALTLTTSGVRGGRNGLSFFLLGANCPFQLAI